MNLIFMGTPDFAVPALNALIESRHNLCAVVTQPDKPVGRKRIITPPPVKKIALEKGIPIFQPENVKSEAFIHQLRELKPDLILVAAFGQILPKAVLEIPRIGCLNVHASLLPAYRGAAPIQWAIINGEDKTGVTIMWMNEGMDTGDIFFQEALSIDENWTSEDLFRELAALGGKMTALALDRIEAGDILRVPQDNRKATYAPMLKKADCKIDWSKSNRQVHNLIRGMNPWPGAYTFRNGREIKIWKSRIYGEGKTGTYPGVFLGVVKNIGFLVGTGEGCIIIEELQEEGKKRLNAIDYLAGHRLVEGDKFSDE